MAAFQTTNTNNAIANYQLLYATITTIYPTTEQHPTTKPISNIKFNNNNQYPTIEPHPTTKPIFNIKSILSIHPNINNISYNIIWSCYKRSNTNIKYCSYCTNSSCYNNYNSTTYNSTNYNSTYPFCRRSSRQSAFQRRYGCKTHLRQIWSLVH